MAKYIVTDEAGRARAIASGDPVDVQLYFGRRGLIGRLRPIDESAIADPEKSEDALATALRGMGLSETLVKASRGGRGGQDEAMRLPVMKIPYQEPRAAAGSRSSRTQTRATIRERDQRDEQQLTQVVELREVKPEDRERRMTEALTSIGALNANAAKAGARGRQ